MDCVGLLFLCNLQGSLFYLSYLSLSCQEFLDREKENNSEKEKSIQATERQVAKCRLQHQDVETARVQLKDELETLKFSVEREANDLDKAKSERKQLSRDVEDKKIK